MMPQEGLSEFVEMTLCDLYVVVEMQESRRKRHWGMKQEESWLVHSGHPHLNPIDTVTVLSVMVKVTSWMWLRLGGIAWIT